MKRPLLIAVILAVTMAISFLFPKPDYTSLHILDTIDIPERFSGWRSFDVSEELNLRDDRYNFISDAVARVYQNKKGEELLLLVLDAGNFHNPKGCYTSSGFTVKELKDVEFKTKDTAFNVSALMMDRQNLGMNLFYWLVIDQKRVNWTGQKVLEFWSSLMNKKKAGLMIRLEIPSKGRSPDEAIALGREFIFELNDNLPLEDRPYLFGK